MSNQLSSFLSFVAGIVIGGAVAWYFANDKYAKIAQEEIDSVKEAYARRKQPAVQSEEHKGKDSEMSSDRRTQENDDISAYARKLQEAGYTDYSTTVVPHKMDNSDRTDIPYVIAPYEFGELDDYAKASLTYFADEILADEYGDEVVNVEEIVGDALSHFGEFEDDSVYVRNEAKRCDYEILKSLDTFEDFLETHNPKKEG